MTLNTKGFICDIQRKWHTASMTLSKGFLSFLYCYAECRNAECHYVECRHA
jgi:hypothetical protein